MCFEWSVSLMPLKLLPHSQLISLGKRQKDNLDRKVEKESWRGPPQNGNLLHKEAEGESMDFLRSLGSSMTHLEQLPFYLNTL